MTFMGKPHALFLAFVFAILPLTAIAQQAGGVITGRVISEDGQPIPHALVSITGVSGRVKQTTTTQETVADDDGNFAVDGLESIPHLVSAWAPGYVPASDGAVNPSRLSEARFIRVGEAVTIKLVPGGVITGRVTNEAGKPITGAPVKATLVKDETGHSTSGDLTYAHLWTRTTDDRGVYRIYGLAPGSYIVAAGGTDASSARPKPFAGRTTTYYPSSTRDAATIVDISSGAVVTGIDIRYRGERGFAISGKIQGAPGTTSGIKIFLRSPTSGETIETTTSQSINNQNVYAFYGVPNGEYELVAGNDEMVGENGSASMPRRVIVKGADVNGVDLTLVANATISGVFVVEKVDSEVQCQNQRDFYPQEIIIRARRDDPPEKREHLLPAFLSDGLGIPDDKGAFTIRNLKSGRHRIEVEFPDQTWYLKAIAMTGSKPAIDPRAGLIVKSGDKLSGLRLTIASGAATLKGIITVAENRKLPTPLYVHLIPAEAEAADDILRFAETTAEADGAFTFTNLSPGKYFVVARAIPASESGDKSLRLNVWEPAARKKLRNEAEAAKLTIELKPCLAITGYALGWTK